MLRRLAVYLAEMFPPWTMVPMAAVHFLGVQLALQALAGMEPLVFTWRSIAGTLGVLLWSLALRVQDELKDLETDLRLGKAGDPRYVNRPIVTGRVLPGDLVALRWFCLIGVAALSAGLGRPASVACVVVGALVAASFRWFFIRSMPQNLLLAFVTHNPLSAAISSWAVAVCVPEVPSLSRWIFVLVLGLWMPVAAWEVARKVRAPSEETDYTTYSKILGPRVAATVVALFVSLSVGALASVAQQAGLGTGYLVVLAVAALAPLLAVAGFLATGKRSGALRPAVELYATLAGGGLIVALCLRHGARV